MSRNYHELTIGPDTLPRLLADIKDARKDERSASMWEYSVPVEMFIYPVGYAEGEITGKLKVLVPDKDWNFLADRLKNQNLADIYEQ